MSSLSSHTTIQKFPIALLAVLLLLQLTLIPHIQLLSGSPHMGLVALMVITFVLHGNRGMIAAFLLGLLCDVLATHPLGLMAGLFSCTYFVVQARHLFTVSTLRLALLRTGAVMALLFFILDIAFSLMNGTPFFESLLVRALPSFLLTLPWLAGTLWWMMRTLVGTSSLSSSKSKSSLSL